VLVFLCDLWFFSATSAIKGFANPRKSAAKKLLLNRLNLGVLTPEALHPAGRIQQLLFAGKERMAIGADFYVDVAAMGRSRGKTVTACAQHTDVVVSGMYGCFHGFLTSTEAI
jgi:hypothetical protein